MSALDLRPAWQRWAWRFGGFVLSFAAAWLCFLAASPLLRALFGDSELGRFVGLLALAFALSLAFPAAGRLLSRALGAGGDAAADPSSGAGLAPALGTVGRYEVLALLELGPWWTCYLARKPGALTSIALTVPDAASRADEGRWRALKREARILQELKRVKGTPELIKVEELEDGCPALILRPHQTRPLGELAEALDARQVVAALRATAKILAKVHEAGVVHRLINLESVVIDDFGRIQLRGFAYAQRKGERNAPSTLEASLAGQAPEQLSVGAVVDARADIYAFGALAARLLTGSDWHPEDVTPRAIQAGLLTKARREALFEGIRGRHPELHGEHAARLADLCCAALEPDPRERSGSCAQLLRELEGFRSEDEDEPLAAFASFVDSRSAPPPAKPEAPSRRRAKASRRARAKEESRTEELGSLRRPPARGQQVAPPAPADEGSIATLFGESLEDERQR